METRVALLGIIVEDAEKAGEINTILHEAAEYVVGRMGVPYKARAINVISVILDAPETVISSVSGKLGQLPGVSTKTLYAKLS